MRGARWFPFLTWFNQGSAILRGDILAGLALGLVLVPQGLAYARLAGVDPVVGLHAAILPTIVAALFGACGALNTGPVAMTSLLTAAVVSAHAEAGSDRFLGLIALMAMLVGVCRLVIGLLKASWIADLISHPVMTGFTIAAAVIIGGAQLGETLGVDTERTGRTLVDLWHVAQHLGDAHLASLAMGVGCLAAFLAMRRWTPRLPGALLVSSGAIALAWATDFTGAMVGAIPTGLPHLSLPPFEPLLAIRLMPEALWVTLIGLMEVLSITRAVEARERRRIDLDQELVGQGFASIASSLCGAFPVSGSVNRSAFNMANGARTGLSNVIAALLVLLALLCLGPVIAYLPLATLGALVIVSVIPLLDPWPLFKAWRANHRDAAAGLVTLIATLSLAPRMVEGILVGAGLAIALHLHRTMRPRISFLAPHADGTFRDAERHCLPQREDILVLRFDARLCFVNAPTFERTVIAALADHPMARWILIAGHGINDIDATGIEMLRSLVPRLRDSGIGLAFYDLKAQITDAFDRSGLTEVVGPERLFRTPEAAIAALGSLETASPKPV